MLSQRRNLVSLEDAVRSVEALEDRLAELVNAEPAASAEEVERCERDLAIAVEMAEKRLDRIGVTLAQAREAIPFLTKLI